MKASNVSLPEAYCPYCQAALGQTHQWGCPTRPDYKHERLIRLAYEWVVTKYGDALRELAKY